MPVYRLLIKAELENIESLSVVPDNQWCIDVACGSERKDGVFVSSAESQEIEGSRCDLQKDDGGSQFIGWYTSRREMARSHLMQPKAADLTSCFHRGTAHLVLKFPGTNKQSTISIVDPAKCATYTEEDSGKFKVGSAP